MPAWDPSDRGVLVLPSGLLVRGRSLRRADPTADPTADPDPPATLRLVLQLRRPRPDPTTCWVRWPDFGLPLDPAAARDLLRRTHRRLAQERVEVGCRGGVGRTGTALACLAVLDGLDPANAIALVRRQHHPRAVETLWQRRFVRSVAR